MEIVVTARKREESLEKTPISISAYTAADLESRSLNNLSQISASTPSLSIAPSPQAANSNARHATGAAALEMIAGFTVCNDVSVREWQMRSPTATLGKSFDTHGPLGPWMVTRDALPDPHQLWLKTWVNGELRQNGNTDDLVYQFREMIEELTAVFTLEPGDILSTGSPAGVGGAQKPPIFLKVGDIVRVEVEGIGHIENRVVEEPESWS
jgi:2-keto-4-pentenoate hydratase/2-oxohepta-3-ene-1,7-dioic acid hydratase in catechol pathway